MAKRRDFLKKEGFTLSGEDIREGLTCVLHVKVREPQFEGQTKTKLGNSEVEGIVKAVVNENLGNYLEEHPPVARHHREGGERGPRARGGSQGARPGPQGPGWRTVLPASWPTAPTTTRARELYLVEGDSAGGGAKQARKREFQAILPLRGKILNVGPGSTRSSATKRSAR